MAKVDICLVVNKLTRQTAGAFFGALWCFSLYYTDNSTVSVFTVDTYIVSHMAIRFVFFFFRLSSFQVLDLSSFAIPTNSVPFCFVLQKKIIKRNTKRKGEECRLYNRKVYRHTRTIAVRSDVPSNHSKKRVRVPLFVVGRLIALDCFDENVKQNIIYDRLNAGRFLGLGSSKECERLLLGHQRRCNSVTH